MKKLLIVAGVITIGAGVSIFPAEAALFRFNNRNDWESAVGSFQEENFNSFTNDTSFFPGPLDIGDFTLEANAPGWTGSRVNKIDVLPAEFSIYSQNGTPFALFDVTDSRTVTIRFDEFVFGFGANFSQASDDFRDAKVEVNGMSLSIPATGGGHGSFGDFFGFTSDTAFDEIIFRGIAENDVFGVDNVVYNSSHNSLDVPEPSSLIALLSLGLMSASGRLFVKRSSNS